MALEDRNFGDCFPIGHWCCGMHRLLDVARSRVQLPQKQLDSTSFCFTEKLDPEEI